MKMLGLSTGSLLIGAAALTMLAATACQEHSKHATNQQEERTASTDDLRRDSAEIEKTTFGLYCKANDLNNRGELDSLEAMVPDAKMTCLKYGKLFYYYNIWALLADRYIWTDQFDKAVAEAQQMQEDAMKRNNHRIGLFNAYKTLGIAYAYNDKYEEAVKHLSKAIEYYPKSATMAPLIGPLRIYYESLRELKHYDTIDSLMAEWKVLTDSERARSGPNGQEVWYYGKYYYYLEQGDYLTIKKKYESASAALDSASYYQQLIGNDWREKMSIYRRRYNIAYDQGDYQTALKISQTRVELAKKMSENSHTKNALYEELSALEKLGRYREALQLFHEYQDFSDSLRKADGDEQLNELNKRFEVNELKMQAERDRMASERKLMQAERAQLYFVIAIILLVLLGVVVFYYFRRRADRRMSEMKAAQERIEGELRIARDIQMSMVPSVFPQVEGLDMYASMTPAKEVGGDLYGYVQLDNLLYFVVGDVSGKGIPASLFMAQATRLFRTLAAQGMQPAEICTRMNNALSGEDNQSGMFVTLFLGLFDLKTGHLSFCNAGHNPPVISDEHSGSFLDMEPNAPIGLWPGLEYVSEEIANIKGRPLFIYTDGLNEAENKEKEQLGDDRLLSILRQTHFENARQVIETLSAAVEKHRNGAEPNDDLTMMCIKMTDAASL